jgi:5-methylcytosine-specific restriction endonuclease McrA
VTGRSTTQRDRDRAAIRRDRPPCGICGGDIDYSLPYLDPMSYVVDHVVPVIKGGEDIITNKQAAHRLCNSRKYDKSDVDLRPAPRTFVTHREW